MPGRNQDNTGYNPPSQDTTTTPPSSGGDTWTDDELKAANQWYTDYINRYGKPPKWQLDQAISKYKELRQSGQGHQPALDNSIKILGWIPQQAGPGTMTTTDQKNVTDVINPPGGGGGGGGGGDDTWTKVFVPPKPNDAIPVTPTDLTPPSYTAPSFTAPSYTAPPPFSYKDFTAPTLQDALNDPGYQFRTQQGNQGLQNWAAARGTLNDSGTAKALMDYNQGAASQEYQNVWNRDLGAYSLGRQNALDTYNTNYRTQFQDPWQTQFQGAQAAFAPKMAQFNADVTTGNLGFSTNAATRNLVYSTQAAVNQHQNDFNYQNAWNRYLEDYQIWKDTQDRQWNRAVTFATL